MATYQELRTLFGNNDLRNKIEVACIIAASAIQNELDTVPNHAARLKWARQVYDNPRSASEVMLMAALADKKDLTTSQILAASDEALQTVIDDTVDLFALGIE